MKSPNFCYENINEIVVDNSFQSSRNDCSILSKDEDLIKGLTKVDEDDLKNVDKTNDFIISATELMSSPPDKKSTKSKGISGYKYHLRALGICYS